VELGKLFNIGVNPVINEYKANEDLKIECTEPPSPSTLQTFEILTNNVILHSAINNGKVLLTRNRKKHAKFDIIDRKPIRLKEIRSHPL